MGGKIPDKLLYDKFLNKKYKQDESEVEKALSNVHSWWRIKQNLQIGKTETICQLIRYLPLQIVVVQNSKNGSERKKKELDKRNLKGKEIAS